MKKLIKMENNKITKYKNINVKILSKLKSIDGTHKEINISIKEDGFPVAVAFFDIDKTLAELKDIHGIAIRTLFKEFFNKDFNGIENVYFEGFRLGNSFREFDRMDCIYNLNKKEYIDLDFYIKDRLIHKKKEIDSPGTKEHNISEKYLKRYVEIASSVADEMYLKNKDYFENSKIKPIFELAKFYKLIGVPMFGMTANGKKFVDTLAKYLGLTELFIDIATDEDMLGGGKEVVIPKLIKVIEDQGILISKEKLVIIGDSLYGDIGSGYKYKNGVDNVFIKGILVVKNSEELTKIRQQISENTKLKNIIKNTDTEAFVFEKVKFDKIGNPLLFSNRNEYLIKL